MNYIEQYNQNKLRILDSDLDFKDKSQGELITSRFYKRCVLLVENF